MQRHLPYGDAIFTRPNLVKDWDPCTDCRLCVSACRYGLASSFAGAGTAGHLAGGYRQRHPLAGLREEHPQEHRRPRCVASFSWETLAYLALNKKLVLDLTPCGECENDVCAALLRKELTRLVEFLDPQSSRAGSRWPMSRTKRPTMCRS